MGRGSSQWSVGRQPWTRKEVLKKLHISAAKKWQISRNLLYKDVCSKTINNQHHA